MPRWLSRLSHAWAQRRLFARLARQRKQRREVTRLELAYRLDQAERMSKAYVEAWGKERDRLIRQLDVLRARQAELDEILRTIRTGVQVLAVEDAAARAREAAVSGFWDLPEAPRDLTERSDWGRL